MRKQLIPVLMDFYTKHNLSFEDLKAECRIFSRVPKGAGWPKDKKRVIDLVQVAYIVFNEYGVLLSRVRYTK